MNTYTITSPSVLWECGKVEDFSIFPQNIKKKDVMDCIQECSYKNSGFCIINKKHDNGLYTKVFLQKNWILSNY